jgi:hypothetical protein
MIKEGSDDLMKKDGMNSNIINNANCYKSTFSNTKPEKDQSEENESKALKNYSNSCEVSLSNIMNNNYEKLRQGLTSTSQQQQNFDMDLLESKSTSQYNLHLKVFYSLQKPDSYKEIKYYVNNMLNYIHENDISSNLMLFKVKLQTRFNDYKNNGLRKKYFVDSLVKMQNELISKIYQYSGINTLIEQGKYIFAERKKSSVISNSLSESLSRKSSSENEMKDNNDKTEKINQTKPIKKDLLAAANNLLLFKDFNFDYKDFETKSPRFLSQKREIECLSPFLKHKCIDKPKLNDNFNLSTNSKKDVEFLKESPTENCISQLNQQL